MSDLISRKAVMEELLAIQDVTYMSACINVDECKGKRWTIARAIDAVKDVPAVDAVPVVRCKYCRYSDVAYCRDHKTISKTEVYCVYHHKRQGNYYFCADGERRADNGTD